MREAFVKLTRSWVIPEFVAREYRSKDEAYRFLASVGLNIGMPHQMFDDLERGGIIVRQEQERSLPPDQPSDIEREMLRELVDDEDLWFYKPEMGRCKTGDVFYVAEMPEITHYRRDNKPQEIPDFKVKNLRVQKYGATVNYERVEILAAIDPDSMEVYWCRVQPR